MCGRIVDFLKPDELAEQYRVLGTRKPLVEREPNYNLKPTQAVRAVRPNAKGARELALLRWGFVPAWSKDLPKQAWINAKAENMEQPRSMWKAALKARRCLVPVSGFYEWTKPAKGPKQPYYIHFENGPMTFAGLWEAWQPQDGDSVESVALSTVAPSQEFARFHDRQVVILRDRDEQDAWLDPDTPTEAALTLLRPLPMGFLQFQPVGAAVNSPGYHGPECIAKGCIDEPAKPLKIKRPLRGKASHTSGSHQPELL